jgi:hypothetical protein
MAYVRKPPPPKDYHWRKAWVGSVSVYDAAGKEIRTWRYATEADADPSRLAERVAADVAHVLRQLPELPVHVVQDAAPELRALPELQRVEPIYDRDVPAGARRRDHGRRPVRRIVRRGTLSRVGSSRDVPQRPARPRSPTPTSLLGWEFAPTRRARHPVWRRSATTRMSPCPDVDRSPGLVP